MQCVVFHLADDRYALDARSVVEIIPSVALRQVPGVARHLVGVLDYRGLVVPVVDLGVYLGHAACEPAYATRIVICDVAHEVATRHGAHERESLVGVRAERVVRIEEIDPAQAGSHAGPPSPDRPALGRIVSDAQGLLQMVSVGELLPPRCSARSSGTSPSPGERTEVEPIDRMLRDTLGLEPSTLGTRGADGVVTARMRALGLQDPHRYAALLRTRPAEFEELVARLMVNETWFYRYPDSFAHLGEFACAWLASSPGTTIRILSAPCSTGEEPVSAAIALLQAGLAPAQFQIDALDISPPALQRARAGRYLRRSFRDIGPDDLAPWIQPRGDDFGVASEVLQRIRYAPANLLDADGAALAARGPYHAILCRNLQIYLTDRARQVLLTRLEERLLPRGVLYVGHAELGRVARGRFEALLPLSAFACRPRAVADQARERARRFTPSAPSPEPAPRRRAPSPVPPPPALEPATPLQEARALADRGQVERALGTIERAIRFGRAGADLYHLQAVLLSGASDPRPAREALRRALYLDPSHYASLVQAALLADRDGDAGRARRFRARASRVHQEGDA